VNIASGNPLLVVKQNSITVDAATTTLNFTGSGVTVTDASTGNVTVNIPGGGSGGSVIAFKAFGIFPTPTSVPFSPMPSTPPSTGWTTLFDTNNGLTVGDPDPPTSNTTLYYTAPSTGYYEIGLLASYSTSVNGSPNTSLPSTDVFISVSVLLAVNNSVAYGLGNGSMTVNNGLPPIANYGSNSAAPAVTVSGTSLIHANAGDKIWFISFNDYPTTYTPPYGTYVHYDTMVFFGWYLGN
jgi:hypothetical protein